MSGGRERERAAPRAGGSLLGGGAGSHAPLAVVVEEGPPCARRRPTPPRRRRGPRRPHAPCWPPRGPVRETERDRERAREDKDGLRSRVGIRPCPRGDKDERFFSPSAWSIQNFRRLLVWVDVNNHYQK
jgi:hypothetical protein